MGFLRGFVVSGIAATMVGGVGKIKCP